MRRTPLTDLYPDIEASMYEEIEPDPCDEATRHDFGYDGDEYKVAGRAWLYGHWLREYDGIGDSVDRFVGRGAEIEELTVEAYSEDYAARLPVPEAETHALWDYLADRLDNHIKKLHYTIH